MWDKIIPLHVMTIQRHRQPLDSNFRQTFQQGIRVILHFIICVRITFVGIFFLHYLRSKLGNSFALSLDHVVSQG